jgi:hypothetical protein
MRWLASSKQRFAFGKWSLCRLVSSFAGVGVSRRKGEPDRSDTPTPAAKFMLPRVAADDRSRLSPASARQGSSVGACD